MKNDMKLLDLKNIAKLPLENIVIIDTETTGLEPGKDEVLSIAIVDASGNELFYSLIKPLNRKRWPNATEIHGITWADVKEKPTIYDIGNDVADILENASLVVGYNVDFDMDMLEENGLPTVRTPKYDLMEDYAKAYGRWSDRKNGYLWCKLVQCAKHYGYSFAAHNALEDAKATAFCYKKFHDEVVAEIPKAEEREKKEAAEKAIYEKEMAIQREQEEAKLAGHRKKKLLLKAICLVVLLASIMLFFNSCSVTGGDVLGTIVLWLVSAFIAFTCLLLLFI